MLDNEVLQAQSRVREMNRMNRQFAARSNRYMNNIFRQTKPDIAPDPPPEPSPPPPSAAIPPAAHYRGKGTRFVPQFSVPFAERQRHTHAPKQPAAPKPEPVHIPSQYRTFKLPFDLRLNGFDEEKLIIMALIVLLYREKADIKLILALGYLIM